MSTRRHPLAWSAMGLSLALLAGCGGIKPWQEPAALSPRPQPRPGSLHAGFGKVDITPPTGVGLTGNGPEGNRAAGYRMRLYARALVLDQASGDRVALVVADLPHISLLLQRRVAYLTRSLGIGVDRLLLSATHTHASVGHFYEAAAYNEHGSSVPGFDADILDSLSTRIARAVRLAVADLGPARAGWGALPVWGQTRIRSLPAMLRNIPRPEPVVTPPSGLPPEYALVDPMLTMLRVDRWDQNTRAFRPTGAWSVFAIHGTGNSPYNDLLDPDLPGLLAKSLERYIGVELNRDSPPRRALYLVATGAAGDVSPDWPPQSRCAPPRLLRERWPTGPFTRALWTWVSPTRTELADCRHAARRAMAHVSDAVSAVAESLFTVLGDSLHDSLTLERSFVTLQLAERAESLGICDAPLPGMSAFGGTPDGRTRFYGWRWFGVIRSGIEESSQSARSPTGCHAQKRLLFWEGATKHFIGRQLPTSAQLLVLRLGPRLIAGVPAEVTTMAARQMRDSMVAATRVAGQVHDPLIVSLANGFLEYVTTADEYTAQFYEGGSTLYGPGSATMLARALGRLVRTLSSGDSLSARMAPPVRVSPGVQRGHFTQKGDARPWVAKAWCTGDTVYARLGLGRSGSWLVRDSSEAGEPLVEIRGQRGSSADVLLAVDDDPAVELHRLKGASPAAPWELRWTTPSPGSYSIGVRGAELRATAHCPAHLAH
jgi:neutral ceramidase